MKMLYTECGRSFKSFFKPLPLIIFSLFLCVVSFNISAQQNDISFYGNRNITTAELQAAVADIILNEAVLEESILTAVYDLYRSRSYLFASIDSAVIIEGKMSIQIDEGPLCLFGEIRIDSLEYDLQREAGDLSALTNEPFSLDVIAYLSNRIIELLENRGYPYAEVELSDIDFKAEESSVALSPLLIVRANQYVLVDSVVFKGNEHTSRNLLMREARIKSGIEFKLKELSEAAESLRRLSYIEHVEEPQFYEEENSIVEFTLFEKNASSFSGLAGYVPALGRSKGYVIGAFNVNLGNLFGTGRELAVDWKKVDRSSQEINLNYREPWVAGLPASLAIELYQNIHDSTFTKRHAALRGEYRIGRFSSLSLSTGLEKVITDQFGQEFLRAENADSRFWSAGFIFDRRDNIRNPRKGVYYTTEVVEQSRKGSASDKRIKDRKILAELETIVPIRPQTVLFSRAVWKQTTNSGEVPISEQWYLGGEGSLRGYREKQFQASRIAWFNLELRQLLSGDSRMGLFFDGGFTNEETLKSHYGYGFGIQVNTRAGLIGFDLGLAAGDSFSEAKLHVRINNSF